MKSLDGGASREMTAFPFFLIEGVKGEKKGEELEGRNRHGRIGPIGVIKKENAGGFSTDK